jgi:hypothetical protein
MFIELQSKQIRQTAKALQRLQGKQAKSASRVGSLRGKLEKANPKLQKIEVKTVQQVLGNWSPLIPLTLCVTSGRTQ